jgi:hypothetical protein
MGAREQLSRGTSGFLRYVVLPFFGFVLFAVLLWLAVSFWVTDRYRITATVVKIDAPEVCWEAERRGRLPDRQAYRSDVPELTGHYCGLVELDRGWVELPPTRPAPLFSSDRAKLLGEMRPGCRYDFVLNDPWGDPEEEMTLRMVTFPPRILRIAHAHPCSLPDPA